MYQFEKFCLPIRTYHSRWLTIASGYLRTLLFKTGNLSEADGIKFRRIVSHIICVCVRSFMIHLNPGAPEGYFLTLFQRDLLAAFREIDLDIDEITRKHYLGNASQWLSWQNVALGIHAEVASYSVEAVKTCSMPRSVDDCSFLSDLTSRLRINIYDEK